MGGEGGGRRYVSHCRMKAQSNQIRPSVSPVFISVKSLQLYDRVWPTWSSSQSAQPPQKHGDSRSWGRGCLMSPPPPPVWNLRAVIQFHLTISSLVLLPTPIALIAFSFLLLFLLSFLPTGPFSWLFSRKLWIFIKRQAFWYGCFFRN